MIKAGDEAMEVVVDGSNDGGCGNGGPSTTDKDKFYCTHCGKYRYTQETRWDL